ncbi:hypothetical protein [Acinetobacter indicus]|uniref:hypothetical protein n=1 Tax=Acinetobacter indicus TaxID=756892 RepID=UPI001444372A|nr:hypothetical protein [Acinetobacter indicus]
MGFSGRLQNWQGLKVWEGQVAEQLDLEKMQGSGLLLAGGEKQLYIDFGHPDNQPIRQYIENMVKIQNTNWNDAILPKDTTETVEYLLNREASKKTVQQGQILRATSSTSRANSRESSSNKADR